MNLRKNLLYSSLCVSTLLGFTGTSNGATILWGAATDINDINDVSTNGALVEARNGSVTSNTGTVDVGPGLVTFQSGDLSGATAPAALGGSSNADVFLGTTGNAGYDQILSNVDFGGTNGVNTTLTVADGLLMPGQVYEIQVWFADTRNNTAGNTRSFSYGSTGGAAVSLNDQFAIGTFTADGTSQGVIIDPGGNYAPHINAYQVRLIPEPSSAAFVGLAGLALALRRRKRG